MRERVQWIDTAKFLGIFAIYLGHFGNSAGYAYKFVFEYHVALFFFLSGCMNNYDKENNIVRYSVKKFKAIILPFWFFCLLSIVINVILTNGSLINIKNMLIVVAKGNVRNSFFAGSLWFLTCLFSMEIIFKLIKYLKKKWSIIGICIGLYVGAERLINPRPIVQPHWWYNLDSVCYYIIFFAIGYVIYPYILNVFQLDSERKKIIFIIVGGMSVIYSALLFFGKDCLALLLPDVEIFIPVMRAMLVIFANLVVAKTLETIKVFNEIGRNTLYLCGNEYVIKTLVPCFFGAFGLGQKLASPLAAYLYTMFLLIVGVKIIIPFEKKLELCILNIFKPLKVKMEE